VITDVDELSDEEAAALQDCFTIGDTRTFEQDPELGLVVLAEIASRALSPAVNDPGTAIDVIGTATRLLAHWQDSDEEGAGHVPFHRVHVPPLLPAKLFDDAFRPIARVVPLSSKWASLCKKPSFIWPRTRKIGRAHV